MYDYYFYFDTEINAHFCKKKVWFLICTTICKWHEIYGYVQIFTIWQIGHFNHSMKQNLNMVKFRKMWFIRFHLIYFEKRDPSNEMFILIQKLVYRMLDLLMASSHHWDHLLQLTYANFADRLEVEYLIVVVSVKKS